jgi:hypothetical protein
MNLEQHFQQPLQNLPADAADDKIQQTARTLEGMSYTPVLLLDTPGFLTMKADDIRDEVRRVMALNPEQIEQASAAGKDPEKLKFDHLNLLFYHYRLLCRLRRDEPEAWDEVNELYEDD